MELNGIFLFFFDENCLSTFDINSKLLGSISINNNEENTSVCDTREIRMTS